MFSYILFSAGKSVRLKHILTDYSAFSLLTIKNKFDVPTSVGFLNVLFRFFLHTRGIWKVLSMVFYLSNLFTNPIMFGLILKRYFSSMLWNKFHEDIITQTQTILF